MFGKPMEKPSGYYEQSRPELVAQLPEHLGRVLDVGCGAGEVGRGIRGFATRLVGVELDPAAAAEAATVYDDVLVGDALALLAGLEEPFDTVLVYDVLEHLADPAAL